MGCCAHSCYDDLFDDTHAAGDLERYRRSGPDPTTRALVNALSRFAETGAGTA